MAAVIPYAIAAVGAGLSAKNSYDVAKRTDNEAAQGIASQAARQRQADARVNEEVQQLGQSSPEGERDAATAQFMDQLKRTRNQQYQGGDVGASSDEFKADTKAGKSNVIDFGKAQAGLMARMSAPGRQRTNEQIGFGRAGSELGAIGRNASGDAFLSQLRMRGVQRNPWIDAASGVASGAASGTAQNSGYGGEQGTTSVMDNGQSFYTKAPKVRY